MMKKNKRVAGPREKGEEKDKLERLPSGEAAFVQRRKRERTNAV